MILDELRLLEHTNTQVRYLPIVCQILRTLGTHSSPLSILKGTLKKWSVEKEKSSEIYRNHSGILTNNFKETTAFLHYIDFMTSLGLITRINDVVRGSKFGALYNSLENFYKGKFEFNLLDKIFLSFFIFQKDADNMIIILQIISDKKNPVSISSLCKSYEEYLKNRLQTKSSHKSSLSISDKLRRIEYIWQNGEGYSKHIIPQRIEWLVDIGFLVPSINKKVKEFTLSEFGNTFYNSISNIEKSEIKDINEDWLNNTFVKSFSLINDCDGIQDYDLLNNNIKINFLKEVIPLAYKNLDTDGLRRISGLPFYLFVMIVGIIKYKLAISFSGLKSGLSNSISIENNTFAFRDASRINESYLTVNIN